jgi:hypothetical protein
MALITERGNSDLLMCREMTSGEKPRGRIPMRKISSRAADSSVEAPVMGAERCGGVVRVMTWSNSAMRMSP